MIEISNLNKYYDYKKVNQLQALKDISISINDGEMCAIIGASGSGKSTLLHIIAGIDNFQSGKVMVDEIDLGETKGRKLANYRNRKVGIVLQDFALIESMSVIENVMIPLRLRSGLSRSKMKKMALDALEIVGMSDNASKMTNKLSGGQKQRVAIARAVVNEPQYIIADEPTGALDSDNSHQVVELFSKLNQLGKTVIIVTHDLEIAKSCERIIEIKDGMIV